MATYYSDKVTLNQAGQNVVQPKFIEAGDTTVLATFTVPPGFPGFAANDTIQLLDAPPAVRVTGVQVDTQKMDSGTAVVFNVGDSLNAARYVAASNAGQAGGYAYQNTVGVLGYRMPQGTQANVRNRIFATITTAAAGAPPAGNQFVFCLNYNADP